MTNTAMLRDKIAQSGYKLIFIAKQLSITYQALLNKINNKQEFKAKEIIKLRELLRLTNEETREIFLPEK